MKLLCIVSLKVLFILSADVALICLGMFVHPLLFVHLHNLCWPNQHYYFLLHILVLKLLSRSQSYIVLLAASANANLPVTLPTYAFHLGVWNVPLNTRVVNVPPAVVNSADGVGVTVSVSLYIISTPVGWAFTKMLSVLINNSVIIL
jgi:hypothetical protein